MGGRGLVQFAALSHHAPKKLRAGGRRDAWASSTAQAARRGTRPSSAAGSRTGGRRESLGKGPGTGCPPRDPHPSVAQAQTPARACTGCPQGFYRAEGKSLVFPGGGFAEPQAPGTQEEASLSSSWESSAG